MSGKSMLKLSRFLDIFLLTWVAILMISYFSSFWKWHLIKWPTRFKPPFASTFSCWYCDQFRILLHLSFMGLMKNGHNSRIQRAKQLKTLGQFFSYVRVYCANWKKFGWKMHIPDFFISKAYIVMPKVTWNIWYNCRVSASSNGDSFDFKIL